MRKLTLLTALALSLLALPLAAQNGYEVSGVVVDEFGPVIGAAVMEKGTTTGVSTGLDGDFSFRVSGPDAVIEITCIGYATLTFKASEVPASITLSEDAVFLDDVGYY